MSSTSSTPATTLKILTVGSALGQISDLFAKVKSINAKHGKFDLVLCLGDFFGPVKEGEGEIGAEATALLEGKIEVPLPCYIVAGEHPIPQPVVDKYAQTGGELANHLFLLGKSAIFTTAEGLRIACLGGTYDAKIYHGSELPQGFTSPYFNSQTVSKLLSNTLTTSAPRGSSLSSILSSASASSLVDILLTFAWPASVSSFSAVPLPTPSGSSGAGRKLGAPPVDEVVAKTKPKYVFAGGGGGGGRAAHFWEREPFVWDDEGGRVSRFVSLGAFGGETPAGAKKQRWFYAFSITPGHSAAPPARPANTTKNPFDASNAAHQGGGKRAFDTTNAGGGDAEDFRWGQQPGKRSRTAGGEPSSTPGKPPPGYRCKRCDSTEHFINDCPERQTPPEGYVCRVCSTPGHFVRDCPTRHAVGDTGGRKPPAGYVCRACASELHYLDDCPQVNARSQQHSHGGDGYDGRGHHGRGRGRGRGRGGAAGGPPRELGPDECWFCLSNPVLEKHLLVAIGTEVYLALPKGSLLQTSSSEEDGDGGGGGGGAAARVVPGGGHVLIVPIAHTALVGAARAEAALYKTALRALYAAHGAQAVFFEVVRPSPAGGGAGRGAHSHLQAVPVPDVLLASADGSSSSSSSTAIENAFRDADGGGGEPLAFEEEPVGADAAEVAVDGGYFRVELPDGRKLVHWMRGGGGRSGFNLQFGRQVLASLLGVPERADWKACVRTVEEDTADAQAFKAAFARHDPAAST